MKLVAGTLALAVVAGCTDSSIPPLVPEQSTQGASASAGPDSGSADTDEGGGAHGSPAPTVAPQAPGAPLIVAGAELAAPEHWRVSGVSADPISEVVSATSDDGQFIALRSVRSDVAVEDQIASALDTDAEQSTEAPEFVVDGHRLLGVETALTASGGRVVQLQYFIRQGESLVTIDIVTTAEQRDALLAHLGSSLTFD